MAKKVAGKKVGGAKRPPAKPTKPAAPDHLTMNLFGPGMSAIHRAGLGGLACTLKAIERHYEEGIISKDALPAPYIDGQPPWEIDDQMVTLKFGEPANASEYLRKLFEFAFQLRDGMIYLPGQYSSPPPSLAVRAELQTALTRTILQGAKKNIGLLPSTEYQVDPDGDGGPQIQIEYQQCEWYLHQRVWKVLVDVETGELLETPLKRDVDGGKVNYGSLFPGAIKRHDALNESEFEEPSKRLLCVTFFLVGAVFLRQTTSNDGVLVVPEPIDLLEFVFDRLTMTPHTVSEARVAGLSDAAFQNQLRLRSRSFLYDSAIPSCSTMSFSVRTWTKPQRSRVDSIRIDNEGVGRFATALQHRSEQQLNRFEYAMALLPSQVRMRKDGTAFWHDSLLRPFVAANLALGQAWYHRFSQHFRSSESRRRLSYEKKGINAMVNNPQLYDRNDDTVIIRAVHEAVLALRGKIWKVYEDRPELAHKKLAEESERWSRAIAGCMSLLLFRKTLSDMLRRAGPNPELQKNWEKLLPFFQASLWEHARDLTLIALCSYADAETVKSQRVQG